MPTYVILGEYTKQGIENIEDLPDRLDLANDLAESLGGEIKEFYLTFGQYDFVTISEAPDDETALEAALTIAQQGAVRTETLKAFPADEAREIVGELS